MKKNINLRKKRKVVQATTGQFWKRWISEYLPTLTFCIKLNKSSRNCEK